MNLFIRFTTALALTGPLLGDGPEIDQNVLRNLDLPGVTINMEAKAVDVASTIALDQGSLEFIACTKDTKEHESIVTVEAKPSHIHTALLLLGAKAGHPAIRKIIGEDDDQHWIDLPPKGSPVTVSLVIPDKNGKPIERPLSDFVNRLNDEGDSDKAEAKKRLKTFLFAGSHLVGKEDAPKTYLADQSGSVISLSTFGDELLCLPQVYGHENHALQWEVDSTHLPEVETNIILRIKPGPSKGTPSK
ncbi:YdjY domain-containing protein [Akkermansiaceae bacterium]|nr:YdjY domain-containing protein [Akkermansiaceae bacterium]